MHTCFRSLSISKHTSDSSHYPIIALNGAADFSCEELFDCAALLHNYAVEQTLARNELQDRIFGRAKVNSKY